MLLAEARRVMLEDLLPLLPADRHYDARMTANAMAIAGARTGGPAAGPARPEAARACHPRGAA